MKRTIFIDGLGLVDGHFSGIGQYILGILRGLDEVIEARKYEGKPIPRVSVIVPRDEVKKFKKFQFKHIGCKSFPLPFRYMAALWHRGKLPPIDLWCGRGSYIFPRFVDMRLALSKSAALVIFDLSYELHREYSDDGNASFLSAGVQRSVNKARNVIAISDNGKREIMDFYGLESSRVSVATPATDPKIFYRRSQEEIDNVKQLYGIHGDYILSLSNLEPRKNLSGLVDAYCRLPRELTDKTALLLVGVNGWKTEELFEKIKGKVDEGYNIIRASAYVKDKHKPALISGAKMLVYPSHYEGFGMPPLEALACGVPVITSNSSSLPEVVGKAGKMVASKDGDALYEAMLEYLRNIETKQRESLTEGPRQAEKFDWSDSAKVFLETAMGELS